MKEILTAVDIAASPEKIWRVLTDFASYPKWNPFIRNVEGTRLQRGARLKVRMRMPPGGRPREFSPVVLKAVPAAELRWRGKFVISGLFDGEHVFIIVPQGIKGARLIQRERFTGLLVPLLLPFMAGKIRESFEAMNQALKKVAETRQ